MGNGDDCGATLVHHVGGLVRKSFDPHPPDLEVRPNILDRRTSPRPTCHLIESPIDRRDKRKPEPRSTVLVPPAGIPKLLARLTGEIDSEPHPASSSTIRWRTVSHGSVADSPAITIRARRSISSAHATRTTSASSSACSRLANSSAARSARSPSVSASASRRRSSAFMAITSRLPHEGRVAGGAAEPAAPQEQRGQLTARAAGDRPQTTSQRSAGSERSRTPANDQQPPDPPRRLRLGLPVGPPALRSGQRKQIASPLTRKNVDRTGLDHATRRVAVTSRV